MREPAITQAEKAKSSALPTRERRKSMGLRGHIQRGDGSILDVNLEDLSFNGCRFETPHYLWIDERVRLSVPRHKVVEGTVRWCTDGYAGVEFDPVKVEEKPLVPRRENRLAAEAEITLRRVGVSSFRVTVRDVSPSGCKVELVERPRKGESVLIKVDGLEPLEGNVRWIDGFVAGVEFHRPIHPAVFDLLKPRLKVSKKIA